VAEVYLHRCPGTTPLREGVSQGYNKAFEVGARIITRGPCRGSGDDRCKQPKNIEEVEESLAKDVSLIQVCTCKITGEGKTNPRGFKKRNLIV
jgi:hypothetical protein